MICADDGVDYSKPQLSHAFSQQQTAQHLTRKTAEELRQELKMMFYFVRNFLLYQKTLSQILLLPDS